MPQSRSVLHFTVHISGPTQGEMAQAQTAFQARGEIRACAEQTGKIKRSDSQVEGAASEEPQLPGGACAREPVSGPLPGGQPRAPLARAPRRGGSWRGRRAGRRSGGRAGGAGRGGLSTRRFWLKYSKWRTEEQRVKMRVQPRRQQQQVIITAFYIFIFILNPGSRAAT